MKPIKPNQLEKTFVLQHEQTDCGVACLRSALRYWGGDVSQQRLRELSGTTPEGTSLLGLYQAANAVGLQAEGNEAGIEDLQKLDTLAILHVIIDQRLQHYFVCYGFENDYFLIGDPAKGILKYSVAELEQVWQSKMLLTLQPTDNLLQEKKRASQKWAWVQELIKPDLGILGVIAALGVVASVLNLSMAIFSQKLIDNLLPTEQFTKIFLGIALLGILLFARSAILWLRGFFLNRQSRTFNKRIIQGFYDHLIHLPKSFFDSRKTGELTARLHDAQRIQQTIAYFVGGLAIDFLSILVSLSFLFFYHVPLAWVSTFSVLPLAWCVWRFHGRIISGQKEVMQAYASTESQYIESLQGIATIKVMNLESLFSGVTQHIYQFFQEKIYVLGKTRITLGFILQVFGLIFLVGALAIGSYEVLQKRLLLGELMAVISVTGSFFPAVVGVLLSYIQWQEAKVAFDRMYELVEIQKEQETYPSQNTIQNFDNELVINKIEIRHLSFRFAGNFPIFQDFSKTFSKGQINEWEGENGTGKSTLLQILQGFYTPESGEILINDQTKMSDIPLTIWRGMLGVVPQQIQIFSGSILANIGFAQTPEEAQKVFEFCQVFGFEPFIQKLPQGYLTVVGEGGVHLSGGQRQVIGLARALYRNPKILLLDEPTAATDFATTVFIQHLIEKMAKEVLVLWIKPKTGE